MAGAGVITSRVTVELNEYDRDLIQRAVNQVADFRESGWQLSEGEVERVADAVLRKILPYLNQPALTPPPARWTPNTPVGPVWCGVVAYDDTVKTEVWNG